MERHLQCEMISIVFSCFRSCVRVRSSLWIRYWPFHNPALIILRKALLTPVFSCAISSNLIFDLPKLFTNLIRSLVGAIGHFRVALCLSFKRSQVQNLWYENEFYLQVSENSFSYERFHTWPRFETEAKGNSEMAYSELWRIKRLPWKAGLSLLLIACASGLHSSRS